MVMKKYLYIMMVGAITLSCVKEMGDQNPSEEITGNRQEMTFSAGNNNLTKTALGENNAVLWSAEDALSVLDAQCENNKFSQSSLADDLLSATFTGVAATSENYYAVYPYREGNAISSEGVIETYLSPDQFAVAGGFGLKANLALGVSSGNNFHMTQAGAFLKFSFTGCENVTSICFKTNGGEKISGGVTATYADGQFTTVSKNDGSSLDEVTLYPKAGQQYIAPGTYYVVMLPATLDSGIQILFTEKNGEEEKVISAKLNTSFTLVRNTVSVIPNAISLPDLSHSEWMSQETLNVLFREPSKLMDEEAKTVWPFVEDITTYAKAETEFTLVDGGRKIGLQFAQKSLSQVKTNGFGAWTGSCNKWGIKLPAIEGKKIVKIEYYTSLSNQTGDPKIVTSIGGDVLSDGSVNSSAAARSKYVWNINSLAANTGCYINYNQSESSVFLTGFRVVYRDENGPTKSVTATTTEKLGVTLDQDVKLKGSFVPFDGTVEGYTFGFEYMPATSAAVMSRYSSAESFSGADGYSLRSTQSGEWTNVEATIDTGTTFTADLKTLARGESYLVRAWARVGTDGDKKYGNEETLTILSDVSNGKVWKYGEGEFFTVWNLASLKYEDKANYDWQTRVHNGESYTYGADGLLYEVEAGTQNIEFKGKQHLKFTTGQKFTFVAAESGTASITLVCESTGSSARTINVAVNGEDKTSFKSSEKNDNSPVTSPDFAINSGDKVSITIGANAFLSSIAYNCSAQGATFDAEVDSDSKNNRDNVYNFTVNASEDLAWTAAVTSGAADGVVLSRTTGTGSGTFTLTVPVNYNFDSKNSYEVTVTTADGRVVAENRTRTFNLTQGKMTKVLFGTVWSASFISGWNTAGWVANEVYSAQLAEASCALGLDLPESKDYATKGVTSFKFVVGESGTNATLKFKAKVAANKRLVVCHNEDTVHKVEPTSNQSGVHEISFATVTAGDVIEIKMELITSNHRLYIGTNTISWTGTPSSSN